MFVSVIVPCYNHAPYLKQRIESILNQTYQNFELILLDDVSPDESAEILLSYKDHPKVSHCIINEKNSGSTFHQWNKGMALAQGELIWIAESDDVADLSFLETLVEPFQQNPNLVLAYSQSHRMDSQGNITGSWKSHTDDLDSELFKHNFDMNGWEYIHRFLNIKNTIPNASAVLFKKQTYLQIEGACSHLNLIGDWSVWAKIVSRGDIHFSSRCLNDFRYHATSVIATAKQTSGPFRLRRQIILFRSEISDFWQHHLSDSELTPQIYRKNKIFLYKEVVRNCSFAIRRRHFDEIIPTIRDACNILPVYLLPIFMFKMAIKLIYSIIFDAPIKKLLKK
ncbi:glycosyltransferase family 2 protein [Acinetobacter johnsonii]|uniref:glycosyltransferase family 2 protein n=1 Tax=Acinetobacter johnsonii TaxID=40214 RepID=UPI001CCE0756|nr:glycosyltransferase family A protein [Acinetobacter johnsonii]UBQ38307.1 glycosyltransferase family 2 protein [Acinetobacter johnsonii]